MKRTLLDILACPLCKGKLELTAEEENKGGEIITGSLRCLKCNTSYPISQGIPNLLPPEENQD